MCTAVGQVQVSQRGHQFLKKLPPNSSFKLFTLANSAMRCHSYEALVLRHWRLAHQRTPSDSTVPAAAELLGFTTHSIFLLCSSQFSSHLPTYSTWKFSSCSAQTSRRRKWFLKEFIWNSFPYQRCSSLCPWPSPVSSMQLLSDAPS